MNLGVQHPDRAIYGPGSEPFRIDRVSSIETPIAAPSCKENALPVGRNGGNTKAETAAGRVSAQSKVLGEKGRPRPGVRPDGIALQSGLRRGWRGPFSMRLLRREV